MKPIFGLIRPRWVSAETLPEVFIEKVKAAEARRIAKNTWGMKPTWLRRDLYAVDATWFPGKDQLHSVKVALIREHPRPDLFPRAARRFLTRSFRISALMSGDYWVSAPAIDAFLGRK